MNRTRDFERLFDIGIRQFNDCRFWDAHESWEQLWLEAESEMHRFLQGLIQAAVALHHFERGNLKGARYLYRISRRRLEACGEAFWGLDLRGLRAALGECFAELEPLPEGELPGPKSPGRAGLSILLQRDRIPRLRLGGSKE